MDKDAQSALEESRHRAAVNAGRDWRQAAIGGGPPPRRRGGGGGLLLLLAVIVVAGGAVLALDWFGIVPLGLFERAGRGAAGAGGAGTDGRPVDQAAAAKIAAAKRAVDSIANDLRQRQAKIAAAERLLATDLRPRQAATATALRAARPQSAEADQLAVRLRNLAAQIDSVQNGIAHDRGIEKSLFGRLLAAQAEHVALDPSAAAPAEPAAVTPAEPAP